MESYLAIGLPIVALSSVLLGFICVRHTRIFFGILTLALSQVLYSLALKLFWVTGGTDGLRVARPSLLCRFGQLQRAGRSSASSTATTITCSPFLRSASSSCG